MPISTPGEWNELERPWLWTILSYEDRQPMHGYKVTREAAMTAFAKSWRRE